MIKATLTPLRTEPLSPIEEAAADALTGWFVACGTRADIHPQMAEFLINMLRSKGFVIGHRATMSDSGTKAATE